MFVHLGDLPTKKYTNIPKRQALTYNSFILPNKYRVCSVN